MSHNSVAPVASPPPPYAPGSPTAGFQASPPTPPPSYPPPPYSGDDDDEPSSPPTAAAAAADRLPGVQYGSLSTVSFRQHPVWLLCPHCHCQVKTRVTFRVGGLTWLIAVVMFFLGCFLGCCFIPFCLNSCKDAVHSCPVCNRTLGRYKRL